MNVFRDKKLKFHRKPADFLGMKRMLNALRGFAVCFPICFFLALFMSRQLAAMSASHMNEKDALIGSAMISLGVAFGIACRGLGTRQKKRSRGTINCVSLHFRA